MEEPSQVRAQMAGCQKKGGVFCQGVPPLIRDGTTQLRSDELGFFGFDHALQCRRGCEGHGKKEVRGHGAAV